MIDIGLAASITLQHGSRILIEAVVPVFASDAGGGSWAGSQLYLFEGSSAVMNTEHVGTVTNEAQSVQIPFSLKMSRVIGGTRYVKRDSRIGVLKLTEIAA